MERNNLPIELKDCEKFKTNNKTIHLNFLFSQINQDKIRPAYNSKYHSEHEYL